MIEVIDTHIHFWNLERLRYPWLETDEWRHLREAFEPADLAAADSNVVATVHVQAEMDHDCDPVDETRWLDSLRNEAAPRAIPTVVVGYADLTRDDFSQVLDRHQEFDYFRGIRQEAWFDADAPGALEHGVDLLQHPRWVPNLQELGKRELSFDLLVYAHQLEVAAEKFEQAPGLKVVLNHLGHPSSASSRDRWLTDLRSFSERVPNSYVKLSGLSFVSSDLNDPSIRAAVREAVEVFGPKRCMVASNYPVDRTIGSYPEIWDAFDSMLADLSEADRRAVFVDTAAEFYGIDPSAKGSRP